MSTKVYAGGLVHLSVCSDDKQVVKIEAYKLYQDQEGEEYGLTINAMPMGEAR